MVKTVKKKTVKNGFKKLCKKKLRKTVIMVNNDQNGQNWLKTDENSQKQSKIFKNSQNGQKWSKVVENSQNSQTVKQSKQL